VKAQTINEIFVSVPETELLTLATNNRLVLIDLYLKGEEASVENSFGDKVYLNCLTDDYLSIRSGNTATEIFLLTLVNESQIIGLIQTVCAPVCDSRLEFYTLKWKKLDTELFIIPAGSKSWFIRENIGFPSLDIALTEFHYDAENQILSQTYNTSSCLNMEDEKTIEQDTTEKTKAYKWNGVRFD
jgi:hypothetical protein